MSTASNPKNSPYTGQLTACTARLTYSNPRQIGGISSYTFDNGLLVGICTVLPRIAIESKHINTAITKKIVEHAFCNILAFLRLPTISSCTSSLSAIYNCTLMELTMQQEDPARINGHLTRTQSHIWANTDEGERQHTRSSIQTLLALLCAHIAHCKHRQTSGR